jgi:hypothetical protein
LPIGTYGLHRCDQDNFKVGPLVGIFRNRLRYGNYPSGKRARLFKELFDCARSKGVFLYQFYADNVDLRRRVIKGYTLNSRQQFYSAFFPMPDVVYNRIRLRNIEKSSKVKKVLHFFKEDPHIYLFNSRFLNKWEVHKALSADDQLRHYVPETKLLTKKACKYFLGKEGTFFLKPMANSLGNGIVKISLAQKGDCSFQHSKSSLSYHRSSLGQVLKELRYLGVIRGPYLIQKGIDLATYRGRVFDLRAQVQKDIYGNWVMTGVGIRVAGSNRIVTHVPNGGAVKDYDMVVGKVFGKFPGVTELIDSQLQDIAYLVPRVLEKHLKNIELAIISMDIGIDRQGRLWVIEVNSKPSYFNENHIREVHTRNLVDYFIFSALNNLGQSKYSVT